MNNLSRLLAKYAVRLALPESGEASQSVEITDGGGDRGIDAVGVDVNAKLVVLAQSKWRQDGKGSIVSGDVLKFLDGVRALLGMKSDSELVHASAEIRTAIRDVLITPGARIRLVTVSTASDRLSEDVERPILDLLAQLNDLEDVDPVATHDHINQADLFRSIVDSGRQQIDIELTMSDWGKGNDPMKVFYGRVSAAEIAHWFKTYGTNLFSENIRVVIPRSDINEGIFETIKSEPDKFFYYNNGITMLADAIVTSPTAHLNRETGYFKLIGASVVNGAQTVSTLGAAIGTQAEDNLGKAVVLVRCIEVRAEDGDLGRRITRFANTQNVVSSQDFAFLDPQQHRLAHELKSLGYEYLLRAGEVPKSKDRAKVIEVREAAVALACASSNIGHAMLAKREVSRLFSDQSVYKTLFNPLTSPLLLQRAVLVLREVEDYLDDLAVFYNGGLDAGVVTHGGRVIAHLVMQRITRESLEDPAFDIEGELQKIEAEAKYYADEMYIHFPENAYPGNLYKNQTRVMELLQRAKLLPT